MTLNFLIHNLENFINFAKMFNIHYENRKQKHRENLSSKTHVKSYIHREPGANELIDNSSLFVNISLFVLLKFTA